MAAQFCRKKCLNLSAAVDARELVILEITFFGKVKKTKNFEIKFRHNFNSELSIIPARTKRQNQFALKINANFLNCVF